jgi:predicted nucleic acid-binding Zn ribbon protein
MARGPNDQTLGEVIHQLLASYNLEGKVKQARIIEAWPEVTGSMITNHTRDLYIKGRTLFVKLDSPALKTELSYSKSQIIDNLNEAAGGKVIRDIVFR